MGKNRYRRIRLKVAQIAVPLSRRERRKTEKYERKRGRGEIKHAAGGRKRASVYTCVAVLFSLLCLSRIPLHPLVLLCPCSSLSFLLFCIRGRAGSSEPVVVSSGRLKGRRGGRKEEGGK